MSDICLVHLVRESNGTKPFSDFVDSYTKHSSGADHDLLIVFKGFADNKVPREYSEILSGVPHLSLFIPDKGLDISSYLSAARWASHKYLCFLNSFSVILDANWLSKMHTHILRPEIGLVGAAGSYESACLDHFPPPSQSRFILRRIAGNYLRRRPILKTRRDFNPFPNPHIRTNSFMIARRDLLSVRSGYVDSKLGTLKFESGKKNLTRQIMNMKLKAVVVGRDGHAYEVGKWSESHTFRSGRQSNLLIADNRTEQYAQADQATKKTLSRLAWGEQGNS